MIRKLGAALALACLMCACGSKSVGESIAAAKKHLEANEPRAAVVELKSALQGGAASAELRFLLGKALLATGDAAGAEIELERAVELQYPEAEVVPWMIRSLLARREFAKIFARYGNIHIADAKLAAEVQTLVGEALLGDGRPGDAGVVVARALQLQSGYAPAVRLQARLMLLAKDASGAVRLIREHLVSAPKDVDAWKLLGDLVLVDTGSREQAMLAYRKAVEADPTRLDARETLVALLLLQGDIEAVKREVDAARAAAPKSLRVRYLEGLLAFASADYKAVRERLAPLLQAVPNDANLLRLAGAAELRLGALSQAETMLAAAHARLPEILELRRLLAETYLRAGQPAKALEILAPSLDARTVDADALALAGQAAMLAGDRSRALGYLERAAKLRPGDGGLKASVAVARLAKGEGAAALNDLRRIAAAEKGVAVDLVLIGALMQRRDLPGAMQAVDALERKLPEGAQAPNFRGQLQLQQNDRAGARKSFETALARDGAFLPALVALARIDLAEGKADAARARFAALIERDGRNLSARLAQVDLVTATGGSTSEIKGLLDAAVAADPTDEVPRLALVDFLTVRADPKGALAAAQAGVAALAGSAELLSRLGQAQLAAGDSNQAVGTFAKLARMRPELAGVHLAHAQAVLANKDFELARRSVAKAHELAPQSLAAPRMLVLIALAQEQPAAALDIARGVQKRLPNAAEGYLLEGDVEVSRKGWDAAIAAYRLASTKAEPGPAALRLHRTLLLAKKGAEAEKFAADWRRTNAADTAFVMYLGDTALARGAFVLAEQHYREVLAKVPNHVKAMNNIAWVLATQNKAGALEFAQRASRLAPGDPAMRDTLALALASEKKYREAIEVQQRVVADFPDGHTYRLTLARLYLRAGDKGEARMELERLERVGPAFAGQAEVKRMMQTLGS